MELLCELPVTGPLPMFQIVRPNLYDLTVPQVSPSSMLISYMYYTHCRTSHNQDISIQAKWCAENVPHFGGLAKKLRTARNKLEHALFFSVELFRALVALSFNYHAVQPNVLTLTIVKELSIILEIITGKTTITMSNDLYCPLCKRSNEYAGREISRG